jgi:large subunit ribosomal protein L22
MSGVKVKNSRVHVAPQKVRKVCDLVRNKPVPEALRLLRFCEKKEIALVLTKLINSALAIANNAQKYDLENLKVASLFANEGPTLKRIQPRAQGRAYKIRKRTSHIHLELREA